jgi:uracil-DNA glycosylase
LHLTIAFSVKLKKHPILKMKLLLNEIRQCTHCKDHLVLAPKPIIQSSRLSKIIIIGQAPGLKAHDSGIPWNDKSGDRLRDWLGIDKDMFYNPSNFTLMPMGFCYPGKGKSGDLPPRPECAPLWHHQILTHLKEVKLVLLIGQYAQHFYLKKHCKQTLTQTVENYREYLPKYLPLPHPSPRNQNWLKVNPWFNKKVIPDLQKAVSKILCIDQ